MKKYNQNIKIGGDTINLNNEEMNNVSSFHKSRIAFSYLPDKTIATTIDDEREHRVWLKEDHNIDDETFEQLIRGYIQVKNKKIVIYRSSNFNSISDSEIKTTINDIAILALQYAGDGLYEVWNGVIINKPGEIWSARDIPYTVKISGNFKRRKHNISLNFYKKK